MAKLLSREETTKLCKLAQAGDIEARNKLILANMGLLNLLTGRHRQEVPFETAWERGLYGLIYGIMHFDEDYGTTLAGYMGFCIVQRVRRGVRDYRNRKYHGGDGDHCLSTDMMLYDDCAGGDPITIADSLAAEFDTFEEAYNLMHLRKALTAFETVLNDRERYIVKNVLWGGKTQVQIGKEVGVGQVQVSRLYRQAIQKLQMAVLGEVREVPRVKHSTSRKLAQGG